MKNRLGQRILAMLLTVFMVFTTIPFTAFADSSEELGSTADSQPGLANHSENPGENQTLGAVLASIATATVAAQDAESPKSILYGDVNSDGSIDSLDVTLLMKYLADWEVDLDLQAADVNMDGVVDSLDATLLMKHVADWDVTLGGNVTLSFETNGGVAIPSRMIPGGTVPILPEPRREGYVFSGWYTDVDLVNAWVGAPLTESVTVYAAWTESSIPEDEGDEVESNQYSLIERQVSTDYSFLIHTEDDVSAENIASLVQVLDVCDELVSVHAVDVTLEEETGHTFAVSSDNLNPGSIYYIKPADNVSFVIEEDGTRTLSESRDMVFSVEGETEAYYTIKSGVKTVSDAIVLPQIDTDALRFMSSDGTLQIGDCFVADWAEEQMISAAGIIVSKETSGEKYIYSYERVETDDLYTDYYAHSSGELDFSGVTLTEEEKNDLVEAVQYSPLYQQFYLSAMSLEKDIGYTLKDKPVINGNLYYTGDNSLVIELSMVATYQNDIKLTFSVAYEYKGTFDGEARTGGFSSTIVSLIINQEIDINVSHKADSGLGFFDENEYPFYEDIESKFKAYLEQNEKLELEFSEGPEKAEGYLLTKKSIQLFSCGCFSLFGTLSIPVSLSATGTSGMGMDLEFIVSLSVFNSPKPKTFVSTDVNLLNAYLYAQAKLEASMAIDLGLMACFFGCVGVELVFEPELVAEFGGIAAISICSDDTMGGIYARIKLKLKGYVALARLQHMDIYDGSRTKIEFTFKTIPLFEWGDPTIPVYFNSRYDTVAPEVNNCAYQAIPLEDLIDREVSCRDFDTGNPSSKIANCTYEIYDVDNPIRAVEVKGNKLIIHHGALCGQMTVVLKVTMIGQPGIFKFVTVTLDIPDHEYLNDQDLELCECLGGDLTVRACIHCGYVDIDDNTEDLSGSFDNTNITTEIVQPRCVNAGHIKVTCNQCGRVLQNERIDPLGHDLRYMCEDGDHNGYCVRNEIQVDRETGETTLVWECDYKKEPEDGNMEGKEATCTEDGLSAGTMCLECGIVLEEQEIILALGHAPENPYLEATPDSDGHTAYGTCSKCHEYIAKQIIPKHEHVGSIPGMPATCTTAGWNAYGPCSVLYCNKNVERVTIPAHHILKSKIDKAATCTEAGYKGYEYCNRCDYISYTEIPALGHLWSEELATDDFEYHYHPCQRGCGERTGEEQHTFQYAGGPIVSVNENNETVVTVRLVCTICGGTFNSQATSDKCMHTSYLYVPALSPTCIEEGLSDGVMCAVCHSFIPNQEQLILPALGHNYVNGVCTRCGDKEESPYSEGLAFVSNGDGTCYVSGIGTCTDMDVRIPPVSPAGDKVTGIGDEAFMCCTDLTGITIPDSVTTIGHRAFIYCTGLTSIMIPESVTSIGSYVFADCIGLTSITVDEKNTTYHSVDNCLIDTNRKILIAGCQTSVIPSDGSVTRIYEAFCGCTGLTSIIIPDSVTSIGGEAFGYCSGLTSITLGNSVTSIGPMAFSGCTGMTSILIPDSVITIDDYAFAYCEELIIYCEAESQPSGWSSEWNPDDCQVIWGYGKYSKGLAFVSYGDGTCYVSGIGTCTDTDVRIPPVSPAGDKVTSIGSKAFYKCTSLTSVTIPDSVTSIGAYAFYVCSGLTRITIPDGVTSIGNWAFDDCSGLTSISIPGQVTSIGDYVFYNCKGLTSITIPDSVMSIGAYAFAFCSNLTSITIPDNVTSIGDSAFYFCNGLISITIPSSVTSIGTKVFHVCKSLESITVGNNNTHYHSKGNCLIETNTGVLIAGCNTSVIPADGSVTSIGDSAFSDRTSLTSIAIPDSVTSIGEYAFMGCTGLTSIAIPDSVTSIGVFAFSDCTGLTSVTIPDSVTNIGWGTFKGCSGLTSITVDNNNSFYHSTENCLIETNTRTLIAGCNMSIIPTNGSVTSIGGYAFSGRSGLMSIEIPDSVTSIGIYAFSGCSSLTHITIPDSVTSIGQYAFNGCSNLAIYCEADSRPSGWNSAWNSSNRPVIWGYTGQ